jgi:MFS family permease
MVFAQRRALVGAAIALTSRVGASVLWLGSHVSLLLVVLGAVVARLANLTGAGFVHAVTVDRAPHAVGRATSIMSTGYYLGALVSPWAFGFFADLTDSYDASWTATVTVRGSLAACASWSSSAGCGRPRLRPRAPRPSRRRRAGACGRASTA